MRAIEYVSPADAGGYAVAAVGYVRLLVATGFEVHWMPYPYRALESLRMGQGIGDVELRRGRADLIARSVAGAESRLKPLIEATSRPVDARVRIIHVVPGYWRRHLSPMTGVRHIGIFTWETDRIPSKWLPDLARMDHLIVPSVHNLAALRAQPERLPAATLAPHLCRETLQPPPPGRLAGLAKFLGIRPDDAGSTQSTPGPRANGSRRSSTALCAASGRRTRLCSSSRPAARPCSTTPRLRRAIAARAAWRRRSRPRCRGSRTAAAPHRRRRRRRPGRQFHRWAAHAGALFRFLVAVEGFGLGGFDAATHGRPVIAVGYGGPVDYLGADWRGRVPHQMAPAENLSGYEWFEDGDGHFWPEPDDTAAFALMRDFAADPGPFRAEAEAISIRIRREFGAEAVTRRISAALDQVG